MSTLTDLLPEIVARIAAESYRTWQLMRLTCKKYHIGLGEYEYRILRAASDLSMPEYIKHKDFVALVIWMIDDVIEEPQTVYTWCSAAAPRRLVSCGWRPFPLLDAAKSDDDDVRSDLVFYIDGRECELIWEGDIRDIRDIYINNEPFQVWQKTHSAQDIIEFVRENIPELHVHERA